MRAGLSIVQVLKRCDVALTLCRYCKMLYSDGDGDGDGDVEARDGECMLW